jgi:hypothetical protein
MWEMDKNNGREFREFKEIETRGVGHFVPCIRSQQGLI